MAGLAAQHRVVVFLGRVATRHQVGRTFGHREAVRYNPGVSKESGELLIRPARREDADAVAALRALWGSGIAADSAFERRMGDWMADEGDRRTFWLALMAEVPAGMTSMLEYRRMPRPDQPESRWGYVGNMFVRAELRGRGIGAALLETVVAAARARRYVRVVLSPSAEAVPFFQRAGFVSPEQTGSDRLLVRRLEP